MKKTNSSSPSTQISQSFSQQSVSKISARSNHTKSYEALATIVVNVLLSTAAIAGLVRLIPAQTVQIGKLHELDQEVASMEKSVSCLKDEFSQSFDLGSSQAASLREKGLISATQRPIKFTDTNSPKLPVATRCN
ncbi:hypothetical protein Syn7502_03466 [Synechococcus sp. PCC 7502]|uniref:hypothetical protein n=1 Tax=Synechococcus sp. PCC 7502 TaxID=1173263 RepID=UPI00029FA1B6|nr:hypothetical protein [Synechococcus sp. PCC 7502]AFY75314.1 hypothetical protein Syn7502_03466 [Synechococcus sp. PCC 7502]